MQSHRIGSRQCASLLLSLTLLSSAVLSAAASDAPGAAKRPDNHQLSPDTTPAKVAALAKTQEATFEETKRVHNERLNELFREFLAARGGVPTSSLVRDFNALVNQHGMTNFDDFLLAETTPLRHRKDPDTGDLVPIMGPLGSDVINPWLAALEVLPGKPLDEQPIYQLAAKALKEHIDFAVIGVRDPTLSLDLLPPKLRENAAQAYRRLNPTNKFDGGFDAPLFYSAVREGAKKLFRVDYPKLRVTMAELVVPEAQGGFGIRSCLLCHDRSHSGVYQRLLSQGTYLKTKAADLPANHPELPKTKQLSEEFLQAAEIVYQSDPDKVDIKAAKEALAALTADNIGRLRPGYPDFCGTLQALGCLKCHAKDADVPDDKDPDIYGAYTLDMNDYFCTSNVKALLSVVNLNDLEKSDLLLKAAGTVDHEGAQDVKLTAAQCRQLKAALAKWIHSGSDQESETARLPAGGK
jgi:hypothetical protein